MLKTRIITALILLALLVPALRGGGLIWAVFCLFFVLAAQWEWNRLILMSRRPPEARSAALSARNAASSARSQHQVASYLIWGALLVLPALTYLYFTFGSAGPGAGAGASELRRLQMAWALLGAVVIWVGVLGYRLGQSFDAIRAGLWEPLLFLLAAWMALVQLHHSGLLVLFSAMGLVWVADIGAYFFGKTFGKRKLAPRLSPGKSWEGALGGAFTLLLLSAIWIGFFPASSTLSGLVYARYGVLGVVVGMLSIGVLSVLGDLSESQLKRVAGMKDSSGLLPGHGGVLDRIDALIPSMPLAAAMAILAAIL